MRIVTWNVNGLRAASRKGFDRHVAEMDPDVMLLQEIRTDEAQLPAPWDDPPGWHTRWHPAEKRGYAGTAVVARHPMEEVGRGLDGGPAAPDTEGRVLRMRVSGVQVASVYLPSGSSGPDKQEKKEAWMDAFAPWAAALAASTEPVVLGGDLNIAHTEDDIWNPKGNAKLSGFLPHERAWFSRLLAQGWTDAVRKLHPQGPGPYSWWSNRGNARALDRGWRIDYLLLNPAAAARLVGARIHRAGGLEISDHAPVEIELQD